MEHIHYSQSMSSVYLNLVQIRKKMERGNVKRKQQSYFIYTEKGGGHVAGSENQPLSKASHNLVNCFRRSETPTPHPALTLKSAGQLVGQGN